ncbi:alpha/beta hydrolase-fold protein [Mesobacillus sp.]|uniref:alpha/beta hydrolase-fold protein n=1 Tax=Mesobacillus sp. TaxID=2675271 RepID=UPI0039F12C63
MYWTAKKYNTNPNETYMAGISLGALVTTYAACTYPHIFKRIAGLSSGFYRNQEEIEQLLKRQIYLIWKKYIWIAAQKKVARNLLGHFWKPIKPSLRLSGKKELRQN